MLSLNPKRRIMSVNLSAKAALTLSIATLSLLTGCEKPILQAMGSTPMPVYHEPRWSGEKNKPFNVNIEAFGAPYGQGVNVDKVHSIGGTFSLQYRLMDLFFVQGSFAGDWGTARFSCIEDPCSDKYDRWRNTSDGKDDYSFWALQEHVLAGVDFAFSVVQVGFGGGAQFSQSRGDYEDKRDYLKSTGLADAKDGKNEIYPMMGVWLAFNLGKDAQYGILKQESRIVYSENLKGGSSSIMDLSYYHPSGFHGGLSVSTQQTLMPHIGKSFSF